MAASAPYLDNNILEPLFRPFTIRNVTLANRLVMSPMTREFSPGNVLNAQSASYYSRRVRGGLGAVVTEGSAIPHPTSHYTTRVPNLYGDSLPRWQEVTKAIRIEGGVAFAQLWHLGFFRDPTQTPHPETESIAPSVNETGPVKAMTEKDIEEIVTAYGEAAANAQSVGFNGVEIHGAHGYLLDQFFWDQFNRRTDIYGGPIENRVRFAVEAIREVRRRTGPDFIILFRFSQWKATDYDARVVTTAGELERWLCPLADAGVDVFDASTRRFWLPEFEGSDLNLAGWAKKVTGRSSMTVGSVGLESPLTVSRIGNMEGATVSLENLSRLVQMFDRGDFDLVAVGRIILSNPDWPRLVRTGRFHEIKSYNADLVAERLECSVEQP
jgi:2,4-dienoyl-CoA reductase-like NADH-dependent reductase (Old Yellow Enzyme family)